MKQKKKILVSPLNWGLGHAVRDIPIIHELVKNNFEVIIGGEGKSGVLLKKEFPKLKYIEIKSFEIKYPKKNLFILKILLQIPKILLGIIKEHKQVQKIIKQHNIDLIISDNRYGVYSKKIPSIFISHQIFIQLPKQIKFLEKTVCKLQQKLINNFNKIIIPDYEENENLSGKLSHKQILPHKYYFIGILSQFKPEKKLNPKYENDILVIISGPEPQRTVFETKIKTQLEETNKKVLIISGKPQKEFLNKNSNIKIVSHLPRKEMQDAIQKSEIIISRAGYTTIMDLVKLQKSAILVPTPGQPEQEYLANHLKNKNIFIFNKQENFDINASINKLKKLKPNFEIFNTEKKTNFTTILKSL